MTEEVIATIEVQANAAIEKKLEICDVKGYIIGQLIVWYDELWTDSSGLFDIPQLIEDVEEYMRTTVWWQHPGRYDKNS